MMRADPGLGTQVLEYDPQAGGAALRHGLHIALGQPAAKALDAYVTGHGIVERSLPPAHFDAVDVLDRPAGIRRRRDELQRREVIDPQSHRARLRDEAPRQAPGDADVAVVVDDAAEKVPAARIGHERDVPRRCLCENT
jgi:hypothetical protein